MAMTAAQLASAIAAIWPPTRATTVWGVDSAGVLGSFGANVPLIGYQNGLYGERVEGAGANLCLRSQEFDNATWTQSGAPSVTADSTAAPDGTTTADTLTDSNAAAASFLMQAMTVPNDSTTWCFSAFIKKTGALSVYPALRVLFVGGTPPNTAIVTVNTQTGAVASVDALASGALDYGGWWRVWFSFANNSTGNTSLNCRVYPARSSTLSTTPDVAATGSQVVWGAQLENTAYPTSYMPTTSASASRAATLTVPVGIGELATEFVALVKARISTPAISGIYEPALLEVQGASTSDRLLARYLAATGKLNLQCIVGGSTVGSVDLGGVLAPPVELSLAVRVRMMEIHASIGGAAPMLIASARPAALAKFGRGMRVSSQASSFLNDLVRDAKIIGNDVSDAALQALAA